MLWSFIVPSWVLHGVLLIKEWQQSQNILYYLYTVMWDKVFIYILQMKASKFDPSRQDLQDIMRYISNTLQRRHNGHDGYEITSIAIVCSTVYSGANQRKHQSSASLAFVQGIHRWPVNSSHKWPVMGKMFPFDDVITYDNIVSYTWHGFCWVVRLGGTVCTINIYIYSYIYVFCGLFCWHYHREGCRVLFIMYSSG